MQVNVDFRVTGSIEVAVGAAHRSGSISNLLCLQAVYHSPAAPPTKASCWGPSAFVVTFHVIQFFQLLGKGCVELGFVNTHFDLFYKSYNFSWVLPVCGGVDLFYKSYNFLWCCIFSHCVFGT